ncbi:MULTISPECIES: phage/plasmid primase, P4 family [unclassified Bradyrhizobium]|uniref:DNA primase family protein n=1 Tax=unclassified Bradyrhizobium TaxID=2631580 RepID=UPI002915E937|nr:MULTISPECIES: phage/plasmid primase, P4 family [unclassified Bradyrhizobium]
MTDHEFNTPYAVISNMVEGCVESDDPAWNAVRVASIPSSDSPAPPAGEDWPDDATLAECAELDESDTDNGKRLIRYFGDKILVMQAAGIEGGDFLTWSGRHWDADGGAAGAALLAQRVGDLIQREVDYMVSTPFEKRLIEAGQVADLELQALLKIDVEKLSDEQKLRIVDLKSAVADGKGARAALSKRKTARRRAGLSSKNGGRLRAMLACAAPRLRKPIEEFNADPFKVATLSHTLRFVRELDLDCPDETARRYIAHVEAVPSHDQADYITALLPVKYDKDAKADTWRTWLDKMMPDAEVRRTLQQFTGMSLLGLPLQLFMFHYGLGANGKSVFLETIVRLLGRSMAVNLPTESIIGGGDRNAGGASPDLIRLYGKRMVRIVELPEGKPLQSELIKKLTGGEEIPIRTLFKGYIDFTPRAKPHMSGNGLPKITDLSNGLWRRLLFIHWPVQIAEEDRRDFEEMVGEMLTEAPGILNWMIEGACDFLTGGLYIAPQVRAQNDAYRREMDSVMQFYEDCVEAAPDESVQARVMYTAYLEWAKANSKNHVLETKFGRDMKRHCQRDDGRVRRYLDVRLRADRPRADLAGNEPPAHSSVPDAPDPLDDFVP